MFWKDRKIYIKVLAVSLLGLLFFVGCVIQDITDLASNPGSVNPKWDIGFRAPLMNDTMTLGSLFDIEKMISGDSTDDTITLTTNDDGQYVITYKMALPDLGEFGNNIDVESEVRNSVTGSNFEFKTPDIAVPSSLSILFPGIASVWPIPVVGGITEISYGQDSAMGLDNTVDALQTTIDLSADVDLNNDGSDDIDLNGVALTSSYMQIKFELFEVGNAVARPYLQSGDISISSFEIEGVNYNFTEDPSSDASALIYKTADISTVYFDGDDLGNDDKLDIGNFGFSIACSDDGTRQQTSATGYYFKISAEMVINGSIQIIGVIYDIPFNLGINPLEGISDITDILGGDASGDSDDEFVRLQNDIKSSISLQDVSMKIDATNDFPFNISLAKLFDASTNYIVSLPSDPTEDPVVTDHNGGIISYFDKDDDGISDYYKVLNPDTTSDLIINPGSESIMMTGLGQYFQDVTTDLTGDEMFVVVDNMYFGSTVDIKGTSGQNTTLDLSVFSQQNPLTLSAEVTMPIAIKFFDNNDNYELLDKEMAGEEFEEIADITDKVPIGRLKKMGIDLVLRNNFSFGMKLECNLVINGDASSDPTTIKTISLTKGVQSIPAGESNSLSISLSENFKYLDDTNTEVTYSGDLVALLNDESTNSLSIQLLFGFLPTVGTDAKFSDTDGISVYAEAYGETTLEF